MDSHVEKAKIMQIVYFSGTGGTKRVAQYFDDNLQQKGYKTILTSLDLSVNKSYEEMDVHEDTDIVFLIFAVHAFDAPDIVYQWINQITSYYKKAVAISVSGGGEVWPNVGCRSGIITALENKGFHVVYEKMICMPCNWVAPINDHMAMWLLTTLPEKTEKIIDCVLSGKTRRTYHKKGRLQKFVTKSEKRQASHFGKQIIISDSCTGCGLCEKTCPVNNIAFEDGIPTFKDNCLMCFRCIYACPHKAMTSKNFMVLKKGFSIKGVEKRMKGAELLPIKKCCGGVVWMGVKKYLTDKDGY